MATADTDDTGTTVDDADGPEPTPLPAPRDGVPPVLLRPDEFADAARRLATGTGPIAVDTERASGYKYSARAYLIQLRRTGSGSFLIDPIEHPDALTPIVEALDGPEWILHAADQDLPCLRELDFRCTTLYDTELAGRLLGLPRVNLAAMIAHFLGLGLAKGHGAADWSRRPLPADWLNYAALDVEVLIELRAAIADELAATGKSEWAAQEFEYVLNRPPAPPRADRWRRTSNIHAIKTQRGLAVVRELWTAREDVASRRDIAPGRVLPDSAIVTAATAYPKTVAELTALPVFGGPRQRRQAGVWWSAIDRARQLPDAELPPKKIQTVGLPAINRWDQRNPEAAARVAVVRPAVKELAEQHNLPVENLLSPDLVRQLSWTGIAGEIDAHAVDAALATGGARPWQRELTSETIAAALRKVEGTGS
ncbi:ribonuclease D [Gordonia sp. TBRC 11910]|uniref:Ribonuclease D n=1 Tax=Gordonia asplenii TaxID=2725283 RepID=A0A848KWX7_9ACTN|nr:ribonuclease D [Gordonia asplenii]NMN99967.1 ribonuclease D [Gordonia asplenii]